VVSAGCHEDTCGSYIITAAALLGKGAELSSDDLQWLEEGAAVHVVEIWRDEVGKRVRGRVEEPAGWISLLDIEHNARWAVRQGGGGGGVVALYASTSSSTSEATATAKADLNTVATVSTGITTTGNTWQRLRLVLAAATSLGIFGLRSHSIKARRSAKVLLLAIAGLIFSKGAKSLEQ